MSTATITSQLRRRGLRNCFLNGLEPTQPGMRMLGYGDDEGVVVIPAAMVEEVAAASAVTESEDEWARARRRGRELCRHVPDRA